MTIEQSFYEGRKGQKRFKVIEKNIERIKSEIENEYETSPEMIFLEENIRWEGTALLVFYMAFRKVHFRWNGLRDYGYLRLCCRWIRQKNLETVTSHDAAEMVRSIITREMCVELSEELEALDLR